MSWTKHRKTPYHQQDTDYYCGAATAQMILKSIGAGILDQNTLYASNHAHSTPNWYTSPGGLNFTLNAFMPPPPRFNSFFVVERGNTEPQGSENIVRTLYCFDVATGTLVYGCGHWVAVRGVRTNVEPRAGSSYTIKGFWINNPWPPTPSASNPSLAPPPPHSHHDGCGSGGDRGVTNEYVTYADWQSTYHTGCDAYGVGHLQFISVCDPRRPPLGTLILEGQEKLTDGANLISVDEAIAFVARAIEDHELAKEGPMVAALSGARPTDAQLVQRLDRADEYYYLVSVRRGGTATALARIDALHGALLGVLASEGDTGVHALLDREGALRILREHPIVDFGAEEGRLPIREGAYSLYPALVWRPCMESRSPYYPFHQVTIGGKTIFIGFDGRIYPALHDLGRG